MVVALLASLATAGMPTPAPLPSSSAFSALPAGATYVSSDVAVDDDGHTFVVAQYRASAPANRELHTLLVRLDHRGAPVWTTHYDQPGIRSGATLDAVGDGEIVLSGTFTGTIDFGSGPVEAPVGAEVFVARFDGAGESLWTRQIGMQGVPTEPQEDAILRVVMVGGGWGHVSIDQAQLPSVAPFTDQVISPGVHEVHVFNPYIGLSHYELVDIRPGEKVTVHVPLP